ncbi:hypothetical protein [Candidatus Doolittlea endobia]|uniref:hypothetical protein n=1 Tax=Candidatus Doolittlea endobia TaxID=1778262 RepID=UPI0038B71117
MTVRLKTILATRYRPIIMIQSNLLAAYNRAYQTDPTSTFGGIIAFNRLLLVLLSVVNLLRSSLHRRLMTMF